MAKKAIRPIRTEGNVAYLRLTQGYEAAIDAADIGLVLGHNWSADVRKRSDGSVQVVYAVTRIDGRKVSLHRWLCQASGGIVDHKDCDGLNNRRENLRPATAQQNTHNARKPRHNTSGVKGVTWHANRWIAQIVVNGEYRHLGRFRTIDEAQRVYVEANAKLHGEFGRTT